MCFTGFVNSAYDWSRRVFLLLFNKSLFFILFIYFVFFFSLKKKNTFMYLSYFSFRRITVFGGYVYQVTRSSTFIRLQGSLEFETLVGI